MTGSASWILAVDTATSSVVVAAGTPDGRIVAERSFPAGHRHGERLLAEVERLIAAAGLSRASLAGIVVGTGPGAFTGLRVGLATAKTLAHGMGLPIAGVSTGEALAAGASATAASPVLVLLPAGPHDRVQVRPGEPPALLPGGVEPDVRAGERVVAVDLDGRASAEEIEAGRRASAALPASLLRLGVARLAAGGDDVERLVPEYVTLPRGIREAGAAAEPGGGIAWSRGRP
jgi:tRNA threonylcarbamoyl adenosine modification protein YeaZ